jgi:hypothetical protein
VRSDEFLKVGERRSVTVHEDVTSRDSVPRRRSPANVHNHIQHGGGSRSAVCPARDGRLFNRSQMRAPSKLLRSRRTRQVTAQEVITRIGRVPQVLVDSSSPQ